MGAQPRPAPLCDAAEHAAAEHAAAAPHRFTGVDYIKAAAIVAVVITHAGVTVWDHARFTPLDRVLRMVIVAFQVPSFLIVSGFLYAGPGLDRRTVRRRLTRIVIPYLVASAIIQVLRQSGAESIADVFFQLATGASSGIYYYVFTLVVCIVATWLAVNLHAAVPAVLLVGVSIYGVASTVWPALGPKESYEWAIRDPLHYYGYFAACWVARQQWPRIVSLCAGHAAWIVSACVVGGVIFFAADARGVAPVFYGMLRAMYTLSVVGIISVWANTGRAVPVVVRTLSEASYAIYLYHILVIRIFLQYTLSWPVLVRDVALTVIATAGVLAARQAARALLGERSRVLFGV
jgi:fucose 4-O-acetylase-like acetyltransferase